MGDTDKSGLYVLAISEIGVYHFGMQRIWRNLYHLKSLKRNFRTHALMV